jgi:hypothetical protein
MTGACAPRCSSFDTISADDADAARRRLTRSVSSQAQMLQ